MLTWIQAYISKFLVGIIAVLLVIITFQTIRITMLKKDLDLSAEQKSVVSQQLINSLHVVQQMAAASDELAMRLKGSQVEAQRDKIKRAAEQAKLKAEPIPNNCTGAVAWAKQKSTELSMKW